MNTLHDPVKTQLASFGDRLKELRTEQGWTLGQLASRSGLSKPFLSRLESGDRQASIAAVLTLSQVFELSLAEMFETQVALDPCLIVRKAEAVPREAFAASAAAITSASRRMAAVSSPDSEPGIRAEPVSDSKSSSIIRTLLQVNLRRV